MIAKLKISSSSSSKELYSYFIIFILTMCTYYDRLIFYVVYNDIY